jgi:inosine-uridine nucleoside N-ribohydrolase
LIIDGDWGGDEMQLSVVLLAHSETVEILGATSVFGNTTGERTFANGKNILHFLGADHISLYRGADGPNDKNSSQGDGAHGNDGIGGIILSESSVSFPQKTAVDFILEQLQNKPAGSVSITASGPLTNIAEAIRLNPEVMQNVRQLIIMGGCTEALPAADMPLRQGNITKFAEFNFFRDAAAAQTVMESGLPIVLLPMNCTQSLSLTSERQDSIRQTFSYNPKLAADLIGMMTAPASLDLMKFNSGPFMHDIHCALYLLSPKSYETTRGRITVTTAGEMIGHTEFAPDPQSTIRVATRLIDPDKAFAVFLESARQLFRPQGCTNNHNINPIRCSR